MRRLIRLAIAALLIAFLLWFSGVEELRQILLHLKPIYILYLGVLAIGLIGVSCVKWRLFIRAAGNDAPLGELFKLYLVGYFFNLFAPSSVGGDVARSYHLGKYLGSQQDAFVSTFLERFTGLLAMTVLAVGSVVLGAPVTAGIEGAVIALGLAAFVLALCCFSTAIGSIAASLAKYCSSRLLPSRAGIKVGSLVDRVNAAFDFCRAKPALVVQSLALSFVYHVLTVLNTHAAALAIGWDNAPFSGLFVVTPLVLLVGMVPLTPNGVGIQEGAFLFFLDRIGATRSEGLAVGLVLRAKLIVIGLIGGAIFAVRSRSAAEDDSKVN